MSNKENILDSDLENWTLDLSNFQLISILSARRKFRKDIIEKAEMELASRQIDTVEIHTLEEKYHTFYTVQNHKIRLPNTLYALIIFTIICLFLFYTPNSSFVSISTLITAIYGIKLRFEKSEESTKKLWNNFAVFYLFLNIVLLFRIIFIV